MFDCTWHLWLESSVGKTITDQYLQCRERYRRKIQRQTACWSETEQQQKYLNLFFRPKPNVCKFHFSLNKPLGLSKCVLNSAMCSFLMTHFETKTKTLYTKQISQRKGKFDLSKWQRTLMGARAEVQNALQAADSINKQWIHAVKNEKFWEEDLCVVLLAQRRERMKQRSATEEYDGGGAQ